jgi:hypothetical protein
MKTFTAIILVLAANAASAATFDVTLYKGESRINYADCIVPEMQSIGGKGIFIGSCTELLGVTPVKGAPRAPEGDYMLLVNDQEHYGCRLYRQTFTHEFREEARGSFTFVC